MDPAKPTKVLARLATGPDKIHVLVGQGGGGGGGRAGVEQDAGLGWERDAGRGGVLGGRTGMQGWDASRATHTPAARSWDPKPVQRGAAVVLQCNR